MKTKKCVRFPSVCLWCWWWALSNHIAEIQNLRYTKSLCGRKNAKIKTHIKNKIKFELEATVVCTYARCACTFLLWWKISSWKKECDFISLMLLKFHYYNANNHTSLWAMNLCAACSLSTHIVQRKHFAEVSQCLLHLHASLRKKHTICWKCFKRFEEVEICSGGKATRRREEEEGKATKKPRIKNMEPNVSCCGFSPPNNIDLYIHSLNYIVLYCVYWIVYWPYEHFKMHAAIGIHHEKRKQPMNYCYL